MPVLPEVREPFEWLQQPWGPALACRALQAPHFFTTRQLRLTTMQEWAEVASSLGVAPGRVYRLKQVHGASVVVIRKGERTPSWEPSEGDALVSDDPSVALVVRSADCAPVLIADEATGAVGAVHAGWRGTAAGIVGATLEVMREAFGTKAENLSVAIGPAIGSCCYEVGPELVDAFAARGHARHLIDRWFLAPPPRRGEHDRPALRLDIVGSNRDQLVLAGVPEQHIHTSGLCTAHYLDVLTSFRAERETAGRLAGIIRPTLPRKARPEASS